MVKSSNCYTKWKWASEEYIWNDTVYTNVANGT